MDKFDAMRAFVRVVETGSFTKAAETLGINRARLTQLVQGLEAQLRLKLLHRTTRKVNVTAEGAAYYEHVVRLLGELEAIESDLAGALAEPRGKLRIDVPSPLATMILIPALPAFHVDHPHIRFDIGASDRKVDLIDEGVDCVIRGGGIDDQALVARRIGELRLGIYAAPSYLERHGVPRHPGQLEQDGHHIVRFRWGRDNDLFPYTLRNGTQRVHLQGRYIVAIDDGNAYLAAGLAGLGILWLPDYMAAPGLASGGLRRILDDWQVDSMPLFLAYPPNRHPGRKLRVFIDWVTDLLARH